DRDRQVCVGRPCGGYDFVRRSRQAQERGVLHGMGHLPAQLWHLRLGLGQDHPHQLRVRQAQPRRHGGDLRRVGRGAKAVAGAWRLVERPRQQLVRQLWPRVQAKAKGSRHQVRSVHWRVDVERPVQLHREHGNRPPHVCQELGEAHAGPGVGLSRH
ncbi:hypothetical protein AaE_002751, partial [Aphanomyces astaci]